MTHELPELPTQSGWALEMHGTCVSFVNNAEKAVGMSPGCETPIYTAGQMRAYANARAASLEAEVARLRLALEDMLAGWKYIRRFHGDLYGVGWDRAQNKAEAALNPTASEGS